MERLKVLVVDDESRMRKLVRDFLVKKDFEVLEAGDGAEAIDIFFATKDIALVILDVMMPKMDGWQVCREIRAYSQVPIIMLTAKSDERDELLGFELGVDEYISKPFSPKILVARVEAILRRTSGLAADDVIRAGGIEVNKAAHEVTIDGKSIELSYKEFELLRELMENAPGAMSRDELLQSVWGYDFIGETRTLDMHIGTLRHKLGDESTAPRYIKTVRGVGYRFLGEVEKEG